MGVKISDIIISWFWKSLLAWSLRWKWWMKILETLLIHVSRIWKR